MSVENKYKSFTHHEHILKRPDTYVGDLNSHNENLWIYDEISDKIIKKDIEYIPGLYKIFDEILVNAIDHSKNDKNCDIIKVNIENDYIEVWNNGDGIDVVIHNETKVYVPEMIFGLLLTSTNYDDTQQRITGGRNGYGAKLTNIFSTYFKIETIDKKRGLKYVQEFSDNMLKKSKPIITKTDEDSYTSIKFKPDFKIFNIESFSEDMIRLFRKRIIDAAGTTNNSRVHNDYKQLKVYYNENLINENDFKKYIRKYDFNTNELMYICDDDNKMWEIILVIKYNHGYENISFVNGICTYQGGKHVDYIMGEIVDNIEPIVKKKCKDMKFKSSYFKDNVILFVNSVIYNPTFSSQIKEKLDTVSKSFLSKSPYVLSQKFLKNIVNSGMINYITKEMTMKEQLFYLKKTDGKKKLNINIDKLDDAHKAGSPQSHKCRLILTEGLSGKSTAMKGITALDKDGRDYFGVYPLRGKLLNVRGAPAKQLSENEEINDLKKILGLQHGKKYTSINELRYGGIIIFTDQDNDGYHIKGLIMNFIEYYWPELLRIGFVFSLATPIVKAFKNSVNKENRNASAMIFYNQTDYEEWRNVNNTSLYKIKYYKGLGTSNDEEARDYFTDVYKKLVKYELTEEESMPLAFDKNMADERKLWLYAFDKNNILSNTQKNVTIREFIDKEFIHFSHYNVSRAIPSICDGLKPSQRKVLYSCFLKKLYSDKDEIKVVQLTGFITEKTCYHHGETSLEKAIINMAQNFVGSNNINLLYPQGQFGSREYGGEDSAAPRYISTYMTELTQLIFREEDNQILKYVIEDGLSIEPEHYVPIIPMILVNGAMGIGTGFKCEVPQYNPLDIIYNLLNRLDGKKFVEMVPWFMGFTGNIIKDADGSYVSQGKFEFNPDKESQLHIIELPIGTWTSTYKSMIKSLIDKGEVRDYKCYSDQNIDILITKDDLPDMTSTEIYKYFKLSSKIEVSLYLRNEYGYIKKYKNTIEILEEFFKLRLKMYMYRKAKIIETIYNDLMLLHYKILFIEYILSKKIIIENTKKQEIINKLKEYEFPELAINDKNNKSYDYLTSLPLFCLTHEKIEELREKHKEKNNEMLELILTSEVEMWKKELLELEKKYKEFLINIGKTKNKNKNKKK